jgi:hypothetical protein
MSIYWWVLDYHSHKEVAYDLIFVPCVLWYNSDKGKYYGQIFFIAGPIAGDETWVHILTILTSA